jgi:glycine/D-amino acid oxidase-like deaminating enzyme
VPDVIIVGAGVISTSIACCLVKLDYPDVVILEKKYVGLGS